LNVDGHHHSEVYHHRVHDPLENVCPGLCPCRLFPSSVAADDDLDEKT
jgi:hypothetical protein